jgi:hypothetical protein
MVMPMVEASLDKLGDWSLSSVLRREETNDVGVARRSVLVSLSPGGWLAPGRDDEKSNRCQKEKFRRFNGRETPTLGEG